MGFAIAIKVVLMVGSGLSCSVVGNSFDGEGIKDHVQLIIPAAMPFVTLLGAFGYEEGSEERVKRKRRNKRKRRKIEIDRIFVIMSKNAHAVRKLSRTSTSWMRMSSQ